MEGKTLKGKTRGSRPPHRPPLLLSDKRVGRKTLDLRSAWVVTDREAIACGGKTFEAEAGPPGVPANDNAMNRLCRRHFVKRLLVEKPNLERLKTRPSRVPPSILAFPPEALRKNCRCNNCKLKTGIADSKLRCLTTPTVILTIRTVDPTKTSRQHALRRRSPFFSYFLMARSKSRIRLAGRVPPV